MQADDQEGINAFNKGWQRVKEIQAELDGKKVRQLPLTSISA